VKTPLSLSAVVLVLGAVAAVIVAAAPEPAARAAASVTPTPAPKTPSAPAVTVAPAVTGSQAAVFTPPPDSAIPDNEFGKEVRRGQAVFNDTRANAPAFVGNSLRCASCHLDAGKLAHSAPLWAAYVAYPAYRSKNGHVNTLEERMQGCFRYSLNGKAPPLGDPVLVALESYAFFLASGAPTDRTLPGRGYPTPAKPALAMNLARGALVYAQKCSLCHGPEGQGQQSHGAVVFPPLWGPRSFNWGAGMSSIKNAAGFIKGNMPFSQGNTLTDQEAWDVALFVDSHERPQDPRYEGSVDATRKKHHGKGDMYGEIVNGVRLGTTPLIKH
jgi:thiosulfate dehydrogenase